jgi:hypothetical protein
MRRREFIALFGDAAIWPLPTHAQQAAKIRLIGYLDYRGGISPSGGFAPFHDVYRRRPWRGSASAASIPSSRRRRSAWNTCARPRASRSRPIRSRSYSAT